MQYGLQKSYNYFANKRTIKKHIMLDNFYTNFLHLARNKDTDLMSALESEEEIPETFDEPLGMSLGYIVMQPVSTVNEATLKIKKMMHVFESQTLSDHDKMKQMKEILSYQGMVKFIEVLLKSADLTAEQVSSDMIANVVLGELFNGAPHFRIKVVDERQYSPSNPKCKSEGRYDVYLESVSTNESWKVEFGEKYSKVLYLWFLLHPCKDYSQLDLYRNVEGIARIYKACYYEGYDEVKTKLEKNEKNAAVGEEFTKWWRQYHSKAYTPVLDQLKKRDREDWYKIVTESSKSSLSLPPEYIELPESLRNMR